MSQRSLKTIQTHLEQAFNTYHNLGTLALSPLAKLLITECDNQHDDSDVSLAKPQKLGLALRDLLDEVIDTIMYMPSNATASEQKWRLEDYLHLHYRENISHKELAKALGYSEHHLTRLRDELMIEASEIVLEKTE